MQSSNANAMKTAWNVPTARHWNYPTELNHSINRGETGGIIEAKGDEKGLAQRRRLTHFRSSPKTP